MVREFLTEQQVASEQAAELTGAISEASSMIVKGHLSWKLQMRKSSFEMYCLKKKKKALQVNQDHLRPNAKPCMLSLGSLSLTQ